MAARSMEQLPGLSKTQSHVNICWNAGLGDICSVLRNPSPCSPFRLSWRSCHCKAVTTTVCFATQGKQISFRPAISGPPSGNDRGKSSSPHGSQTGGAPPHLWGMESRGSEAAITRKPHPFVLVTSEGAESQVSPTWCKFGRWCKA